MSLTRSQPAHVFLDLFLECNLRCLQCDIWQLKSPPGELSMEDREQVVREVATTWPGTRLVVTGGELFLNRMRLYRLASICKAAGVYTTINSNGTLVRESDIERLPESGINCIVISLDSDEPDVHDRIRGVAGTFERAVRTVKRLVQARDERSCDFTVLTSTILGSHNLHRASEMVTFFESLGVDTILFQPIQPAFARDVPTRWWSSEPLFPQNPDAVNAAVDTLITMRQAGRRLYQLPDQFDDMRTYFRSPHQLDRGQCASMNQQLMIDVYGDVRLCFNMERIGLGPVGNVRRDRLGDLWSASHVEARRVRMRDCREGCGTMCCHAR